MGEADSTETQPPKPVCDSDDRATQVMSQVGKTVSAAIRLKTLMDEKLSLSIGLQNFVENPVEFRVRLRRLVSKVEKAEELFAAQTQRRKRLVSTLVAKLSCDHPDQSKSQAGSQAIT